MFLCFCFGFGREALKKEPPAKLQFGEESLSSMLIDKVGKK